MLRGSVPTYFAVAFAGVAATICGGLLQKHLPGASGPKWLEAGCAAEEDGGLSNCERVLASPYSYFPAKHPVPEGEEPQRRVHIPVAFLGVLYYSCIAFWFVGIGQPSHRRRWLHLAPILFVGAGLCGSAYYSYIMFTRLEEQCPWCLVTHVLNLLIAVCVLLSYPPRPPHSPPAAQAAGDSRPDAIAFETVRPSARQVVITVCAVLLVVYAQTFRFESRNLKHQISSLAGTVNQYEAAIKSIQDDTAKLVRNWQLADTKQIPIGATDHVRVHNDSQGPVWHVVAFSDFECPSCRRIAEFLEVQVQPMFAGRLRMVFKHFPLHSECNPRTSTQMHPQACLGAKLAEAAGLVGGDGAFWRAHDYLFANQQALKKDQIGAEVLANAVGVDATALESKMASEEVLQRMHEHIEQAGRCGVTGTPSVFLNGKRVDRLAVNQPDFWNAVANQFWRAAKIPRPKDTFPSQNDTPETSNSDTPAGGRSTPDSQGRTGDP